MEEKGKTKYAALMENLKGDILFRKDQARGEAALGK